MSDHFLHAIPAGVIDSGTAYLAERVRLLTVELEALRVVADAARALAAARNLPPGPARFLALGQALAGVITAVDALGGRADG